MTLRKTPTDFLVDELLTPEVQSSLAPTWSSATPVAVLHVRKESLTTPEAAGLVCKALHVRSGAIEYAGLKDKHAVTTQHMSVMLDEAQAGALQREWEAPRWKASLVGFAPSHLRADAIERNHFSIVVRDLSRQAVGKMNDAASLLRVPGEGSALRVINYFGDQRFGSARHGQGFAAKHLIKGDFEAAVKLLIATPARKDSGARRQFTRLAIAHWGDWSKLLQVLPKMPERAAIETLAAGGHMKHAFVALPNLVQTMCVEAYQSYLWNAIARRLVELESTQRKCTPILAEDDYGTLAYLPAKDMPGQWPTLMVPSPSPDAIIAPEIAHAFDDVLRAEGLRLDQLVIPNLRRPAFGAADRPLVVAATNFAMTSAEKDELASELSPKHLKRRIEFDLPRGAYATVVLRALGE
jgi:tRNA pseudouridine13 synthase